MPADPFTRLSKDLGCDSTSAVELASVIVKPLAPSTTWLLARDRILRMLSTECRSFRIVQLEFIGKQ